MKMKYMTYIEEKIDALSKEIDELREEHEALVEGVRYLHSQIIHDEPQVQQTMDEFVRVVRCKDCKNYHKLGADFGGCDEWGEIYIKEDDYCSRGIK